RPTRRSSDLSAEQWDVTDELNGVTQPLLGLEEHALALDWSAVPERLSDAAAACLEEGVGPAPFIFRPALLQIAAQQQRQPQVVVSGSEMRLQRESFAKAPPGGFDPA